MQVRDESGQHQKERELKEMLELLTHQAPPEMKKIGETIRKWFAPIIRMWCFIQNNGITEGFHRKMKLIQPG